MSMNMPRIASSLVLLATIFLPVTTRATVDSNSEKYRPQFHFTAERGWLNDPNGLVYYDGEYHLYFQHNPSATNWVLELSWGHAVSTDLVHWKYLPDVLPPTPVPGKHVA